MIANQIDLAVNSVVSGVASTGDDEADEDLDDDDDEHLEDIRIIEEEEDRVARDGPLNDDELTI